MQQQLDTNVWSRRGHGRNICFYATDREVFKVLEASLPKKYGPYSILYKYSVPDGRHFTWHGVEKQVDDFFKLRSQGVDRFYIKSEVLSGNLDWSKEKSPSRFWCTHGFLALGQGSITARSGWSESDFGLVNRVEHMETGEIITHHEYNSIHNSIKRAIKKILVYSVTQKCADGRISVTKNIGMSEAFAELCRSGKILTSAAPFERLR